MFFCCTFHLRSTRVSYHPFGARYCGWVYSHSEEILDEFHIKSGIFNEKRHIKIRLSFNFESSSLFISNSFSLQIKCQRMNRRKRRRAILPRCLKFNWLTQLFVMCHWPGSMKLTSLRNTGYWANKVNNWIDTCPRCLSLVLRKAALEHCSNSFDCIPMYGQPAVKCTSLIDTIIADCTGIVITCRQQLTAKLLWRKHPAISSPKRFRFAFITWIQAQSNLNIYLIHFFFDSFHFGFILMPFQIARRC